MSKYAAHNQTRGDTLVSNKTYTINMNNNAYTPSLNTGKKPILSEFIFEL
jgi:hypothetical protein